jgi:hypothetical protein
MVIGGGRVYPELVFTPFLDHRRRERHGGGATQLQGAHRRRARPRGGTERAGRGHRIRDVAPMAEQFVRDSASDRMIALFYLYDAFKSAADR